VDPLFVAACVQFDVGRAQVAANLERAERGVREAAASGAVLCVLPEMWTTSFVPEPEPTLLAESAAAEERMRAISAELGLMVVGSAPHLDGGKVFNRAQVLDRGQTLGEYRKIHLFSPNSEHRIHEPGNEPLVLDTRLGRIGVVICYDIRFPELIRYYFYEGVEVLLVPAQWPEARAAHWRSLVTARAIENEMYVIGTNRTGVEGSLKSDESMLFPGDSRIVDPMGAVLVSGSGEDGPLLAEIEPRKVRVMRRILPVAKDRRPEIYARIWQRAW
jgi:predicted amidohydrolase